MPVRPVVQHPTLAQSRQFSGPATLPLRAPTTGEGGAAQSVAFVATVSDVLEQQDRIIQDWVTRNE
jgi:hypothetical protein